MAKDMFWVVSTFAMLFGMLTLALWPTEKNNVVVVKYNCSMLIGGWHPDVPVKVQEECKKRELLK